MELNSKALVSPHSWGQLVMLLYLHSDEGGDLTLV